MLNTEKKLARCDPLTMVANRRAFFEFAENEIRRAQRYHCVFSIAYIDLDNFKYVNDTFGHNAGDEVLRIVSKVLQNNLREVDFVARLSGDEFAIILPETRPQEAKIAILRIHKLLLYAMQKKEYPVTFSIGTVTFSVPPKNPDVMIKIADEVMYSVKRSGKNSVEFAVYTGENNLTLFEKF